MSETSIADLGKSVVSKARTDQHDPDSREYTAMVAVFDTIDDEDDVMVPGCFLDEIALLKANAREGILLPGVWNHDHSNPASYFSDILEMRELYPGDPTLAQFPDLMDKGGLWVRGVSDDTPSSVHLHNMIKGGRISQWSFFALGGMAQPGTREDRGIREIHRVSGMIEVGPTVRGVNTSTATLTAKSQVANGDTAPPATGLEPGARARYLRTLHTYV